MNIQTLYQELSPFYILLYIHDVADFDLQELSSLLAKLKTMEELPEREQRIHEVLVEASCRNKNAKLKNRKKVVSKSYQQKQGSFVHILPRSVIGAKSDVMNESNMEFTDQCCFQEYQQPPTHQYEQTCKIQGKLFGGVQYVQLPVDYQPFPDHLQTTYIDFTIDQQTRFSKLNRDIILRLLRVQKLIHSSITLKINGIPIKFQTSDSDSVLGMDFLQNAKVIVTTNYRPEVQRLQMIFTR